MLAAVNHHEGLGQMLLAADLFQKQAGYQTTYQDARLLCNLSKVIHATKRTMGPMQCWINCCAALCAVCFMDAFVRQALFLIKNKKSASWGIYFPFLF